MNKFTEADIGKIVLFPNKDSSHLKFGLILGVNETHKKVKVAVDYKWFEFDEVGYHPFEKYGEPCSPKSKLRENFKAMSEGFKNFGHILSKHEGDVLGELTMKPIDKADDFLMACCYPDAAVSMKGAVEIISELKEAYEELEAELENERAEIQRCNNEIGEYQRIIGELNRKLEELAGENFSLQAKIERLESALQVERDRANDLLKGRDYAAKTLRDEAALVALPEIIRTGTLGTFSAVAEEAYGYGNAMMEAREK